MKNEASGGIVLVGDMNVDILYAGEHKHNRQFRDHWMDNFKMDSVINQPTRGSKCIDHIYTNLLRPGLQSGIVRAKISDHFATFFQFLPVTTEESPHPSIGDLHLASYRGHTRIVEEILSKHAGLIEATDDWGFAALSLAVRESHRDVAEHLLKKGANMNQTSDINRWTPLHPPRSQRWPVVSCEQAPRKGGRNRGKN